MKLPLFAFKLLHECKQFQFIYIKVSDLSRCLFWCLCSFLSLFFFRGPWWGVAALQQECIGVVYINNRNNNNKMVLETSGLEFCCISIPTLLTLTTRKFQKISGFQFPDFLRGGWVKYSIRNARVTTLTLLSWTV